MRTTSRSRATPAQETLLRLATSSLGFSCDPCGLSGDRLAGIEAEVCQEEAEQAVVSRGVSRDDVYEGAELLLPISTITSRTSVEALADCVRTACRTKALEP